MAGNGIVHANFPILDGKKWERWFRKMNVIFAAHDVYE